MSARSAPRDPRAAAVPRAADRGAARADTRARLVEALERHRARDSKEAADLATIRAFVARHPDPFDRRIGEGHLTGSALVVADAGDRVLLLFHRKLGRWLQPGGHAEVSEHDGATVALREAREETGILDVRLHPDAPRPLDVDVHTIPARGDERAHQHLDLRYLVLAPGSAAIQRAKAEARDLRWFDWTELPSLNLDPGLRRALGTARGHVPCTPLDRGGDR